MRSWVAPRVQSDKRRLVTNTAAASAAQFITLVSTLVYMPYLASRFGLAGFGLYSLSITLASYAILLDFGVGVTLRKRIAEADAIGDTRALENVASTALVFYLFVGAAAFLVMGTVASHSGTLFNLTAQDATLLTRLLWVTAAQSLLQWPLSTSAHVLTGLQRYAMLARNSLLGTAGQVTVVAGLLWLDVGPVPMLIGVSSFGLLAGAANTYAAVKALDTARLNPLLARWSTLRAMFEFSWPLFIAQVCSVVLYQQTDRVILATFLGAAAVGLYEAAAKLQGLLLQLLNMANSAVMPMASSLDAQDRRESLRTLLRRGTRYTLALVLPTTLSMMILAEPLIEAWLGSRFSPAVLPAQLFISHQLLTAGTTIGDSILLGIGAYRKRLPYIVAMTLANLGISLLTVRSLGILGVVIGTTLPYLLDFPFHQRLILKECRVDLAEWISEVIVPTYAPLLATGAIAYLVSRTALVDSIMGVGTALAASVLAYWLVFALGLNAQERAEIRSVIRRIRRTGP